MTWRPTSLLVAAALVAAGLTGTAPAVPPPAARRAPDASPRQDEVAAMAAARASGQRVEVSGATAENRLRWANPDGTFTDELATRPVRARQGDRWADIDTTLAPHAKAVRPKATVGDVSFSDGGAGNLATLREGATALTLGWRGTLPAPVLDGATARYVDALPGVDVELKALPSGFEQSYVLKTRAAAKTALRLPLRTQGLAATQRSGDIAFVDKTGAERLWIGSARMWDANGREGAVGVAVRGSDAKTVLEMSPDAAFLADPDTAYPVTVDPVADIRRYRDAYINSGATTTNYGSNAYLKIGTRSGSTYISYIEFPMSSLAGRDILDVTQGMGVTDAVTCDPKTTTLYRVTDSWAQSTVTWANHPTTDATSNGTLATATTSGGGPTGSACAANAWMNFNDSRLTAAFQGWADDDSTNFGMSIRTSSSDTQAAKDFASGENTSWTPRAYVNWKYYPPDAPTGLTATATDHGATLSWTAADGNGATLTANVVTVKKTDGTVVATYQEAGTATSATITGLTNGQGYTFSVAAVSDGGTSAAATTGTVTPRAVPYAPADVAATAGNGSATVTWTLPDSNGSALTGQTVTVKREDGTVAVTTSASASATTATVSGLTNGTAYYATVTGTNAAGTGPEGSSATVTPAGAPSAPTGVTATGAHGSAHVSWTAPAANGSPITSYTVTTAPGGATTTVTSGTATTVAGLTNGTAYTFTVTATNAVGTSAASSASASVTPNQLGPGAPQNVSATAGSYAATVTWTAPASSGSSAIAAYIVTAYPGAKMTTTNASTLTATISGLSGGVSYSFVVTARNSTAVGASSAPTTGITVGAAPNAPTAVSATVSGLSATVSWTAPTPNGVTITGYRVLASPGDVCLEVASTATSATYSSLRPNMAYKFVVLAKQSGSTTCSLNPDPYDGPMSAPSSSVTTGNDTATAFTRTFNVTSMDGAVKAWWENYYTVPGSTYTLTVNPGGITRTLPRMAVSGVVAGLSNGTTYSVTLTVTNPAGSWTETRSVTPGETMISATDKPLSTDRATKPDISDDGRYVAWAEGQGGETGEYDNDVFIADRQEQAVYEVPRMHTWDERSTVQISGDGRHVAFAADASHTNEDFNRVRDVYVLDRQTDTVRLVSSDANGAAGNSYSSVSDVSPDGRYVLFHSNATNLVTGDYNGQEDLFVKDMDTGAIDLVSRAEGGLQMRVVAREAYLSGDGRYVAGQDSVSVFWHDRQNDLTQRVAPPNTLTNGIIDVAGITRDGATVTFGGTTDAVNEAGFVLNQIPGNKFDSIYQQRVLSPAGRPAIVSYDSYGAMLRGVTSSGVSPDGELVLMHMVAGSETNLLVRDVPRNKTSVLIPGTTSGNNNQSHPRSQAVFANNNRSVSYLWNNAWFSDGVVLNVEFLRDGDAFGKVWYAGWRQGVNTGSGQYVDSVTDVSVKAVGEPLALSRTYNSGDAGVGWFGTGVTSSYESRLEKVDRARLVKHADGRRELFTSTDNATFSATDGNSNKLTLASGVYTLTRRDGSKLKFGSTGRLTEIVDRKGHRTLLTYSSGKLATVTDEVSGRTLTFTWTGARVTNVKSDLPAAGNRLEATYAYTGNDLTSVCLNAALDGTRCTTYEYGTNGKMTGRFNALGQRTAHVTYQADGRVSTSADGGVSATTYAYPKPGVTTITSPLAGQVTTQEHDPAGRLVKETDAYGYTKKITYDANGWPSTVTDENGTVTTTVYSAAGDKLSESVGANTRLGTTGKTAYLTYDAAKNVLTTRDRRSTSPTDAAFLTTFTYDSNNNVLTETGPPVPEASGGHVKQWTYTDGTETAIGGGTMPAGLIETATDRRSETTTYRYASNGDLREVENPAGRIIRNTYDALGRVLTSTDISDTFPSGVTTTYVYDALTGRLGAVEHPQANNYGDFQQLISRTVYDRADRVVKEWQDAQVANGDADRTVDYVVDAGNRVTSATDNQTNTATTYEYDAAGNLSAIVDKLGRRTEFTYTLRNERKQIVRKAVTDGQGLNPRDVVLAEYTYDAAGRLRTEKDALGRVRRHDYDTQNRRTKETLAGFVDADGGTRDVVVSETAYDNVGNVVEKSAGSGLRHETFVVDAMDRVTSHTFDPGGAAERTTAYTYDGEGHVLTRAVTRGTRTETVTLTYDDLGLPASEKVENGATDPTTWFDHDDRGLLVAVTDPRGTQAGDAAYTTDFTYDERGQLFKKELPPVATYTWDQSANSETTGTSRPTWDYRYNHFGQVKVVREPRQSTIVNTYDKVGRQTRVDYFSYQRAHDSVTLQPYETWTYDNADRLTQHHDRSGGITDHRYDGLDHLVGTDLPTVTAGRATWAYTPDDAGRVTSVVDPVGATVQRTFDKLDRVATETQVLRPAGGGSNALATTYFRYDDLGNLVRRTDPAAPAASVTRYEYDAASNLKKVTDPAGKETTATYDLADRQVTVTDPPGRKTEAVYDLAGRQTETKAYDASNVLVASSEMQYDNAGNLTAKRSPRGFWTWYRYDAARSLKRVQQWLTTVTNDTGSARVTAYDHDIGGLLTRSTDGRGFGPVSTGVTEPAKATTAYDVRYTYNVWGLPESVQEPPATGESLADARWTTYYDLSGQPVIERQPGGVIVTRTFDALGRLTAEHGESESGAPAVTTADRTFGYDLAGNLTSAAHPSTTLAFTYDDRGDLRTASHPAGNTTVTRDLAGRPTSVVDPAGTHTFSWTLRSELDTETDPLTGVTVDNDYDSAGQLSRVRYGTGGAVRTFAYDALGRVTTDQLEAADAAATVKHKVVYGYDADGNVTSQAVTAAGNSGAGTHAYGYDAFGRMTSWTKPNASVVNYTWDAADNRTGAGASTYTYDARNRLTSGGGSTYTWSPRGTLATRTTGATTTNYTFDALGRMIGAGSAAYGYDSLDRLVNSGFGYTGLSAEPTKTPGATVSRGPGGDITAISVGGVASLAATNAHGDLAATFNTVGTVAASKTYQPFGATEGTVGSTGEIGFQGDFRSNTTGHIWMGARWYDDATGTFLSRDTMAKHVGAATLMNRYAYADGNPVTASDPDGRCAMKSTGWGGCSVDAGSYQVSFLVAGYVDASVPFAGPPPPPPPAPETPSGNSLDYVNDPDPEVRMVARMEAYSQGQYTPSGNPLSRWFKDAWDRAKPWVELGLSFVPGIGVAMDAKACLGGDMWACTSVVPGSRAFRKADQLRDAQKAQNRITDARRGADASRTAERAREAERAADAGRDATRATDGASDARRAGNPPGGRHSDAPPPDHGTVRPAGQDSPDLEQLARQHAERVKAEGRRPTMVAAVHDTRTGKIYFDESGHVPDQIHPDIERHMPEQTLERFRLGNCAEFNACNTALYDGADMADLRYAAVRTKNGIPEGPCKNCQASLREGTYGGTGTPRS